MQAIPIDEMDLRNAYTAGEKIADIARRYACDPKTVRRHAKLLGLQHPKAPKRRTETIHAYFKEKKVIERYLDGDSVLYLAETTHRSPEMIIRYLQRNNVKMRTRAEQNAETLRKYGTRFYRDPRRYEYVRDRYGLVTQMKVWFGNRKKPIIYTWEEGETDAESL